MAAYSRRPPPEVSESLEGLADALTRYRRESDALTRALGAQILACRRAGATWGEIGALLGMTKQGARKHWDDYLQASFGPLDAENDA